MADDSRTHNDDFDGDDEEDDLTDDVDDVEEDESDTDGEEEFDAETGLSLGGADIDHTISDEAGTRLDLSDIHGGTLKPTDMASEMKQSFLEYSMSQKTLSK